VLRTVLAGATLALSMGQAQAATYRSFLDWVASGAGVQQLPTPYGEVLVDTDAGNPNQADLTVNLFGGTKIVLTGQPTNHNPFVFNLTSRAGTQVSILSPQSGFSLRAGTSFTNVPFGTFNEAIMCCNGQQGGSHAEAGPLHLRVTNSGGVGIGGSIGLAGATQFVPSRSGGSDTLYWFSADLLLANGSTLNVGAREPLSPVPEPDSYAMLLVGIGLISLAAKRKLSRRDLR